MGCPFGCRETHRKRRAAARSADYYGSWAGKVKKKMHNDRRSGRNRPGGGAPAEAGAAEPVREEEQGDAAVVVINAAVVGYVRMVVSLIEGWRVSEAAIGQMLARAVRQHSMARRRRIDYVVDWMRRNAP